MTLLRNTRLMILLIAVLLLGGIATGVVVHSADRAERRDRSPADASQADPDTTTLRADGSRRIIFRNMARGPHRDELASVPADTPTASRTTSGVHCLRFHAAAGTGLCLQSVHGVLNDTYSAVVLDPLLHELRRYPLAGIPTRTRVSPSGRMAAWTVFVGGDSYAGINFSTRTSILDTRSWVMIDSLETFAITKDGKPYQAGDVNFWGVTFSDDEHFYATLATDGKTYLVRGSIATRVVETLRTNVECPSLSPDGTRIAFKTRVPGLPADAPWRLYVLDLQMMREHALAEDRSVDDQAVWTDDHTLAYALPGDFGADLWTVPADGGGPPAV